MLRRHDSCSPLGPSRACTLATTSTSFGPSCVLTAPPAFGWQRFALWHKAHAVRRLAGHALTFNAMRPEHVAAITSDAYCADEFFLSDGIAEEMRFTCLIAALRIWIPARLACHRQETESAP
jgi:hypothetical protein